jgi:hypothetical protein
MIFGLFDMYGFPHFFVSGDATATANNIVAAELTYRIGILISFVSLVVFIALVVSLYGLFKDVNKWHATFMVLLVSIGIAISLANLLNEFAPLILLSGADYLTAFTKPQLDALVLGFLSLNSDGNTLATAFWGLWLVPFGILVIQSRFLPRILGYMLLAAGFAYVVTSVTAIGLPEYKHDVSTAMLPLYFGEMPIILWLFIMGAKEPQPLASSASVR